jgi:putative transposase
MPRTPRKRSATNIYHIMMRGSNRQEIFHDDEDNIRFLETLEKYKSKTGLKVYGWCLMGNHVHLLLEEGNEDISITMKRINVSFVNFYKAKYKSIGHLFQDRYKSESVEKDAYLLTVIRYIHHNPVKAGMVTKPQKYRWSSCNGYYSGQGYEKDLLDKEFILGIFSENLQIALERFKDFNEQDNQDLCLEDLDKKKLTDDEVRDKVFKLVPETKILDFRNLSKEERKTIVRELRTIEGASYRQIARILAVSVGAVFNA